MITGTVRQQQEADPGYFMAKAYDPSLREFVLPKKTGVLQ
jgi:hypothetical protein